MAIFLRAKSKPRLAILLVCCLCMLSLVPSIECIFKIMKKKKFMEGVLVGFLVGNEYAAHKGPKSEFGGHMPPMGGMDLGSLSRHGSYLHDDHHPYMPKTSDRSYRVKPKFIRRRSKKGRIKKMLKFPVYIRKSHH